jgi:FMN phosphatase YigB (HAD superfamily)
MLRAVLLDVGGTLWPQDGPEPADADRRRTERLRAALPALAGHRAVSFMRAIYADCESLADGGPQDTDAIARDAARLVGLDIDRTMATALRRAVCLPARDLVALFPGFTDLFAAIRRLGLRCALVTDVAVRDAELTRQDFRDFGVADVVDAIITSHDVGYRKPHHAMFQAAMDAVGCGAAECVMMGNREARDIAPAVSLGMRAILAAIEEPPPSRTAAHAVVTSLHEATGILGRWAAPARSCSAGAARPLPSEGDGSLFKTEGEL